MTPTQKRTFHILLIISAVYFAAFIAPNLTGAREAEMLSVFEIDEYAQYSHAIRMLTPGETLYQTVRNFFVYLHYFYGYPFYFFSAIAMLPLRLVLGAGFTTGAYTPLIVMTLRQLVNVLPMLLSAMLLVHMQTQFKSRWKSVALFVLLLILPGVVVNNLWWHPDSLATLVVVLTLFFLDRDQLRFGRSFWLAAAACGLGVGVKYMGAFFVLAIPVYLLWGIAAKKLTWPKALGKAAIFLAVMFAAFIISNPLLLLPQERAEIISIQTLQWEQSSVGIILANQESFFKDGYPPDIRIHYAQPFFLLLTFAALGLGIARKETRLKSSLILAWCLPLSISIINLGTRRTHYWLPIMLPLFSTLINLFPEEKLRLAGKDRDWARIIMAALILVQAAFFMGTNVGIYASQMQRETQAPAILFYDKLEEQVFDPIILDRQLVVYRDWGVYCPETVQRRVTMNWDLANHAYIADLDPDVILLDRENVLLFSRPEVVSQAVNPGNMRLMQEFYGAAARDELPGYMLVLQDGFGYALVREELAEAFLGSAFP
jgi:4-amino-4-deoxy-L-arabinose transferase-like glycosyltransferase